MSTRDGDCFEMNERQTDRNESGVSDAAVPIVNQYQSQLNALHKADGTNSWLVSSAMGPGAKSFTLESDRVYRH